MEKQSSDSATESTQAAAASGSTRRYPSRIHRMTEGHNANQIRVAHQNQYGFDVPEKFATDLAAYVRKPTTRPQMLMGDVEQVRRNIHDVYGFWVSHDYVNDLVAFAEKGE